MRELIYVEWESVQELVLALNRPDPYYERIHHPSVKSCWGCVCTDMEFLLGERLVCQKIPTLRDYKAHEKVPYGWHRDTEFGHQSPLYNIWIPLTEIPPNTFSTVKCFSRAMYPGEALIFEASEPHFVNTLSVPRRTIDARFIPEKLFDRSLTGVKSSITGTPLTIGEYFFVFETWEQENAKDA